MASHVVVTSSAARSTKVKVTPGTYMSDVLDQACKSLKLEPGNYLLKSVLSTLTCRFDFVANSTPNLQTQATKRRPFHSLPNRRPRWRCKARSCRQIQVASPRCSCGLHPTARWPGFQQRALGREIPQQLHGLAGPPADRKPSRGHKCEIEHHRPRRGSDKQWPDERQRPAPL